MVPAFTTRGKCKVTEENGGGGENGGREQERVVLREFVKGVRVQSPRFRKGLFKVNRSERSNTNLGGGK